MSCDIAGLVWPSKVVVVSHCCSTAPYHCRPRPLRTHTLGNSARSSLLRGLQRHTQPLPRSASAHQPENRRPLPHLAIVQSLCPGGASRSRPYNIRNSLRALLDRTLVPLTALCFLVSAAAAILNLFTLLFCPWGQAEQGSAACLLRTGVPVPLWQSQACCQGKGVALVGRSAPRKIFRGRRFQGNEEFQLCGRGEKQWCL